MRELRATRPSWSSPTCRASRSTSSWTCRSGRGCGPLELFGRTEFPPIGELPYLLTLPRPRVLLVLAGAAAGRRGRGGGRRLRAPDAGVPQRDSLLAGDEQVDARGRAAGVPGDAPLVRRARLPRHRRAHRRGRGAGRRVRAGGARRIRATARPSATCCRWPSYRATHAVAPHALAALLQHAERRRAAGRRDGGRRGGARGAGRAGRAHARARASAAASKRSRSSSCEPPEAEPRNISAQHAAAAVRYGDRYLLKMFRRLEEGISPELELDPLPERARPRAGARHRRRDRIPAPPRRAEHAGGAAGLRPQRGDGLGARARGAAPFLRARAHPPSRGRRARRGAARRCTSWPRPSRPRPCATSSAPTSIWRRCSGKRTAEMHLALASNVDDASFAPEPYQHARPAVEVPVGAQPGRQDAAPAARQPGAAARRLVERAAPAGRRPGPGAEGVRAVPRPAAHRPAHAHARRLPPGAGALHRQGLRHHRLRRAARPRRWPSGGASTSACATSPA